MRSLYPGRYTSTPIERNHWQWIESQLVTRLESSMHDYRVKSLALDHAPDDDRQRAASEKIRALKGYETALNRFNDFVIRGEIPADLTEPIKPFSSQAKGPVGCDDSPEAATWTPHSAEPRA